jgi:hypothetical protein
MDFRYLNRRGTRIGATELTTDGTQRVEVAVSLSRRSRATGKHRPSLAFRRKPKPSAIDHSDRGSQYASHDFKPKTSAGRSEAMGRLGGVPTGLATGRRVSPGGRVGETSTFHA